LFTRYLYLYLGINNEQLCKSKLQGNATAESLKKIFNFITNNHTISELTSNKTDFTRKNKLTFSSVALKILNSFQNSVEFDMSTFMPKLGIKPVSAGAFSIARYKIKIDFFLELNQKVITYINSLSPKLWKGYRLIAGDGTSISLPVSKSIIKHFGLFSETKDHTKTVLANACILYDVMSNWVLDSVITPFSTGEITSMETMIKQLKIDKSIFILDRGFCSFSTIKTMINSDLKFCVRLKTSQSLFAKKIIGSQFNDFELDWLPSEGEKVTCEKKGLNTDMIHVRATKIILPSGEIEVLISNLFDIDEIHSKDMKELYFKRWAIEEAYKKLKPKMKLEQFGCRKPEGIYQEFYSHIIMLNITNIIGQQAEPIIAERTKNRKYSYKYNWNNAFKFIQNNFIELFTSIDLQHIVASLINKIAQSMIAIIPDRLFSRVPHSKRKRRYSPVYK